MHQFESTEFTIDNSMFKVQSSDPLTTDHWPLTHNPKKAYPYWGGGG